MPENHSITQQFEANRKHLSEVALRMLSSQSDADDAVQEAWLRLNRSDASEIENLRAWLTTVVARVCLDMLRSRKSRSEEPLETHAEHIESRAGGINPQSEVELADSVGLALLVVLEKLSPTERLAFVLHDMFDVPFNDIATIINCTPVAARQVASRARRRVRGTNDEMPDSTNTRQREVVGAFLAASRRGDIDALLRVLDPDVVLSADEVAAKMAAANQGKGAPDLSGALHGAEAVARAMSGRANGAQPALLDGVVGAVWAPGGKTRVAFRFTVADDQIIEIKVVADPQTLEQLDIQILA